MDKKHTNELGFFKFIYKLLVITPSVHKRMQLSLFEESNNLKFDQSYIKKY
jgi:hypothetical protein